MRDPLKEVTIRALSAGGKISKDKNRMHIRNGGNPSGHATVREFVSLIALERPP
jgi:hypothetical protein